ncbi:beta-phosphoglucomutase [Enterococcus casseliflavus]|uniref:beta-phosphoglucomutase n=1 Tax=Enterococcus casseliflavus TaxID=37734 RepID=UPI000EB21CAF|nr:beta-phosphoglucomutase [Enterococcus casseliflavus]AYJ44253.1 beta-phosphoglucomutase [Enterococcus casseliflavus]MBS5813131.1 beta-phosphoglucomutase [Enterococcus casseliflavus]MCD4960990.1 beta-phosphoglucomutase [Enterococcus casseliflavus]MDK4450219.1 beta-phosphoglucomutase [Enterococcus casseliflavus]MDT2978914.1 beta-phosphoglucomutase [Enterococcus casseliflavus]
MKKGFVFDLDGVITDTAKYHYIAWKELASEIGIEIDLKFNEQLKGISRMDSLERILTLGNKNDAYTEVEKEALATKKNTHYVQLLQSLTPDDLLPGVKTFLDEAKAKNIPCAIASASKNAPFILDKLGVMQDFDTIVDPATLKKGKPDPEIFIQAALALGIEPAEAVGFEDAQAGIDGIKAAGMYAVGVYSGEELHGADVIVEKLTDLNIDELLAK